jgi:hypothetical protein
MRLNREYAPRGWDYDMTNPMWCSWAGRATGAPWSAFASGGAVRRKEPGSVPNEQPNTTTASTRPKRTPEEEAVLALAARRNGREWSEKHAELILEQARAVGSL